MGKATKNQIQNVVVVKPCHSTSTIQTSRSVAGMVMSLCKENVLQNPLLLKSRRLPLPRLRQPRLLPQLLPQLLPRLRRQPRRQHQLQAHTTQQRQRQHYRQQRQRDQRRSIRHQFMAKNKTSLFSKNQYQQFSNSINHSFLNDKQEIQLVLIIYSAHLLNLRFNYQK